MAASRRRAKKSRKKTSHKKGGTKQKTHRRKSGKKMPLIVLEHMVYNAEAALKRRGGKPRKHTKAEMKRASKR
jgi:hypothetical protein